MKPIHTHDCSGCVLLGQARGRDVYVCPRGTDPAIILRHGSAGADYESYRVSQMRSWTASLGASWLYALGLYDGYQRANELNGKEVK